MKVLQKGCTAAQLLKSNTRVSPSYPSDDGHEWSPTYHSPFTIAGSQAPSRVGEDATDWG